MVAAKIANIKREDTLKQNRTDTPKGGTDVSQAAAAKSQDVSERSLQRARAVIDADPELAEQVAQGKVKVAKAEGMIRREKRATARKTAAKGVKHDKRIIVGDFREHADKVADGSLSLIFTDLPCQREPIRKSGRAATQRKPATPEQHPHPGGTRAS